MKDLSQLDKMTTGFLKRAVENGDATRGSIMVGQITGFIQAGKSGCEIISDIMQEFKIVITNFKII